MFETPTRPPRYRDLRPDPWRDASRWFPRRISRAARSLPAAGLAAEGLSPDGAAEVLEVLRARGRPLLTMTVVPSLTGVARAAPPGTETLEGSLRLLLKDEVEQIQGLATIGRTSHRFHLLHQPGLGLGLFVLFALDPLIQPNRDRQRVFRSTVGLALELATVGEAERLYLCPDVSLRGVHETLLWTSEPPQAA